MIIIIINEREGKTQSAIPNKRYTTEEAKIARRRTEAKYRQTEKGKISQKKRTMRYWKKRLEAQNE